MQNSKKGTGKNGISLQSTFSSVENKKINGLCQECFGRAHKNWCNPRVSWMVSKADLRSRWGLFFVVWHQNMLHLNLMCYFRIPLYSVSQNGNSGIGINSGVIEWSWTKSLDSRSSPSRRLKGKQGWPTIWSHGIHPLEKTNRFGQGEEGWAYFSKTGPISLSVSSRAIQGCPEACWAHPDTVFTLKTASASPPPSADIPPTPYTSELQSWTGKQHTCAIVLQNPGNRQPVLRYTF